MRVATYLLAALTLWWVPVVAPQKDRHKARLSEGIRVESIRAAQMGA